MAVFLTLVFSILGGVWYYVWNRLVLNTHPEPALYWCLSVLFVASFLIQLTRWVFFAKADEHPALLWAAYFILGFMVHLFFGTLTKDVLHLGLNLILDFPAPLNDEAAERIMSSTVVLLSVIGNVWGTRTAIRGPRIKTVDIPVEGWPESQRGFTIVQISDLHVGPIIKAPYVKNVVEIANSLNGDVTVLTGDIGDGQVELLENDLAPLKALTAKHGVFFIPGNHEYFWNIRNWIAKMKDLGFHVLLNSGEELRLPEKNLWLGGVADFVAERIDPAHRPDTAASLIGRNPAATPVLLAHQPKACFEAEKAGYELMLSGHTHNGQFFPISLLVGLFNPYSKGLNRHGNMWVYVNVGTGFWGPALRLGVPSEVTCLRLVPAPEKTLQSPPPSPAT